MCGIMGYVGGKGALAMALAGLRKLEYRGYDSAGIAGVRDGKLIAWKEIGKVSTLEEEIKKDNPPPIDTAIAHTRWATHGKPTKENAHPHLDMAHTLALVHNGIIENHQELRELLEKEGVAFASDTDSEIIAHLVAKNYQGDLLAAVQATIPMLKGAYAVALIHKEHPDEIVAFAKEAPLAIGIGAHEAFVSSDGNAFSEWTEEVIYLTGGEVAVVRPSKVEIYAGNELIEKERMRLSYTAQEISKGDWEHYTLKEIHEQPQSIKNAMHERFIEEYGTAIFEGLTFTTSELLGVQRILIVACGTSLHAGYVAAYLIEEQARIPVQVEISSEFRYKNPIVLPGTLAIAISQSGETADTIAAIKELQAKGTKVLAICNVTGSTLAREADSSIFLHAGPEIGVCSTKAYTSQVVVLTLFALMMARMRAMPKSRGQQLLKELKGLPEKVSQLLEESKDIDALAQKYSHYNNFFFMGRRYMYPTSLEGALKLKEISYINANAYPAGEMKHGPIALIGEECPTLALCADKMTYDKLLNNMMEIKARNGPLLAVVEKGEESALKVADDVIWVPPIIDELSTVITTVALQLFAYYVAKHRGTDIDQPRNLAKSVTVE